MTRAPAAFDPSGFLPYLLNQAAEVASLEFQKTYKDRYGMLRTEWRVLFHLGVHGSLTAKDIVTRAKIHKTKISRAVAKLEERRFLTRMRNDEDRRFETLTLTHKGKAVYLDLKAAAHSYDADLAAAFTDREMSALRQMLKRIAKG